MNQIVKLAKTPAEIIREGASKACPGGATACDQNLFDFFFGNITTALIFIIGAVAVLMIIIGGLRYVLSGGDPASTKSAKDTILYAVIGLIVAILAFAIVKFVTSRVGG